MSDSGFKTCGTVESENWTTGVTVARLVASDDYRAGAQGTTYLTAELSDFTFGIPAGALIVGIEILAEISCNNAAGTATISALLSHNDGTNWTSSISDAVTGTTDTNKTLGGPTTLWGRVWSVSEFANGTFRVKVQGKTDNASYYCLLDYLAVKVYYTETGSVIKTLGAVTLDAVGSEPIYGSAIKTLGAVAISADGWVQVDGSLEKTLGAVVISSEGVLYDHWEGEVEKTLGAVVISSEGVLQDHWLGEVEQTLGAVTISAVGMDKGARGGGFIVPVRYNLRTRRYVIVVPERAMRIEVDQ